MGRSILPVALLVAWWATASANPRVYVPNGGNVSVMDTSTDSVIATIPLSTGASGGVAAAASRVYVGHAYQGSVAVPDVGRNTVSSIIRFPDLFQGIQAIALSPDGRRAFASVGNQVSIIDTTSNTVSAGPYVGRPLGLAVHPDGTRLYVASVDTSKLAVIDIATNTVTANVDVDPYAHAVLVHPDGTRVYVTSTTGTVSVVDTATNVASMKFAVGSEPFGIAVHPDGTRLYVTDVQRRSS